MVNKLSAVGNAVTWPSIVTVWPEKAVREPLMMYAVIDISIPYIVVGITVAYGAGATRTVGCPLRVTVWPMLAVLVPLMMKAGVVVATPLIVVGTRAKTVVGAVSTVV